MSDSMITRHLVLQYRLSNACGVNLLDDQEALVITAMAGAKEFMEMVDFFNDKTKPWKVTSFDRHHVVEELIDVYHFFLQALNILEVDEDELDRVYCEKRNKNFQRIKEKLNAP